MHVTEDLNVCVGIGVTQCLQSRQSENKIANRAAADHQNPVHISTVATALRAVCLSSKRSLSTGHRPVATEKTHAWHTSHSSDKFLRLSNSEGQSHATINKPYAMQTTPA